MAKEGSSERNVMSIGAHIEDLRKRLMLSIIPPLPLAIFFFLIADPIVQWFLVPLHNVLEKHGLPTQVQVLSPPEFLIAEMKIALGAAILTAGPWILYQLWRFVSPGLYLHERRFVYFLIPMSTILGLLGLALMYYIMLPVILDFMITLAGNVELHASTIAVGDSFSGVVLPVVDAMPIAAGVGDVWVKMPEGIMQVAVPSINSDMLETLNIPLSNGSLIAQQFQLSSYLTFVIWLMFAIALAFQLPMVMLLLGWIGVLSPAWLRKNRKYAVLVLALISAIITPQDAISMLMMLLPLYFLYEFGIALIVFVPAGKVSGEKDE